MIYYKNIIKIAYFLPILLITSCKSQYAELENGLYAEIITTKGIMVAQLAYKETPVTVANFVSLAEGTNTMVDSIYENKKFYNGLIFHRVIDSFMIQGGDPLGNGSGNPGYRFKNEKHPKLKHNKPGILAMANGGPNINGSQFYITEVPKPNLDKGYTIFGELVLGIDIQDSISNVKTDKSDKPLTDVIINEVNIIRKGDDAKSFDAPKVFKNYFIEEAKREKAKKEKTEAFLKATKKKFKEQKANAIKLASGLQYYISKIGEGEKLPEQARVKTHYAVYFEDGTLLDTSIIAIAESLNVVNQRKKAQNGYQPIVADIGPNAQMIPGFKKGLQQLRVGDKATLFLPYYLAYGEAGNKGIPPKSNLIFEVEVLELVK